MKIASKTALFVALIILVSSTCTSLYSLKVFNEEMTRQVNEMQESRLKTFWAFLRTKGGDFRVEEGRMLVGDYVLNESYELPDQIQEIFGGTATIFMGDVRIATNVLDAQGRRAIGTKLQGKAHDAIFKEGKAYRGETTILGVPYFTAYDPIRNSSGEVVGVLYVGVKRDDYFSAFEDLKIRIATIVGVILLVLGVFGLLLARAVLRPLAVLAERLREIACGRGDLTRRIPIQSRDEIGEVAGSFNQFLDEIQQMIIGVGEVSREVADAASSVGKVTGEMRRIAHIQSAAVQETSASMQTFNAAIGRIAGDSSALLVSAEQASSSSLEITASMEEAAQRTGTLESLADRTATALNQIAASIAMVSENIGTLLDKSANAASSVEQIKANTKEIGDISARQVQLAREVENAASGNGIEAVRETGSGIGRIGTMVSSTVDSLNRLGNMSTEIGEIVSIIQDIADATSLLALNASILAAQAGEHGKGFAVVAEEVKNLAQQAAGSSQSIGNIIGQAQAEIAAAHTAAAASMREVEVGVKLEGRAEESLNEIIGRAQASISSSLQVERATGEQLEGVTHVSEVLLNVRMLVEQIRLATEELRRAAGEILISTEDVRLESGGLFRIANAQARESRNVSQMVEDMFQRTQVITEAVSRQEGACAQVSSALTTISEKTRTTEELAAKLHGEGDHLRQCTDRLGTRIGNFQV